MLLQTGYKQILNPKINKSKEFCDYDGCKKKKKSVLLIGVNI